MSGKLDTLTVKELQDNLVKLGMKRKDVEVFKTKAPLISTIITLEDQLAKKKEEKKEELNEINKKVASITEKIDPREDRKINKQWLSKAQRMKEILFEQEQVSVLVPLEAGEKVGKVEWRMTKKGEKYQEHISGAIKKVQINGYKFYIPKGVYYKVPMQIAQVISQAEQQILENGQDLKVDRLDPNTGGKVQDLL